MAPVLDTPAYQRTLARASGYQEFQERKWDDLSEIMWGTMAIELGASTRRPRRRSPRRCTCPMLVLVGAQDKPFVDRVAARWPRRSRARSSSSSPTPGTRLSSRIPTAWIDALHAVPRVAFPRRRGSVVDAHGGRLAVEVLQQHDVDTMFTLSGGHLFVLYDGAVQTRPPARRRPPRADRDVRRRRLGQGDAPARVRGAHRGPGRHQRRERDDRGVHERLADRRARPGARRRRVGVRVRCRSSTTCRSSRR